MAKKLSKKKRQQLKQKQQNKLLQQGYKPKDLQRLSNADLKKLSNTNIPQAKAGTVENALKIVDRREKDRLRKQAKRQKQYSERREKLQLIEKIIGTDVIDFEKQPTAKFLDSLSLDGLRKGRYKRTYFKDYVPREKLSIIDTFDFEKMYPVPGGKKLHFAYRSLIGDIDIAKEIEYFNKKSNEELISDLRAIMSMPQTRTKKRKGSDSIGGGSSGQAGEALIRMNSQAALSEVYSNERNADRRTNNKFNKLLAKTAKARGVKFQHTEINYHWQNIRQVDGDRLKAYTEINARKLLIIGNAILWNITEADRQGFYNEFYYICCEIIPDMKKILP